MLRMHTACVTTITIRNVPEHTRNELASRAAAAGWSLQEYLLHELMELTSRPDPHVLVARIRERKRSTTSNLSASDILDILAEDRR